MLNVLVAALMPLIEDIIQGLARLGWGMIGIPYPEYFENNIN